MLVTNDTAQDELAGPFESYKELEAAATASGLTFEHTAERTQHDAWVNREKKKFRIKDLKAGTLFRVDAYWYRLTSHIPGNRNAMLEVVGEKRTEDLPVTTEVTEVSVLDMS